MTTACWGCAQKAFQSGGDLQTELTACETDVAPSDPLAEVRTNAC